MTALGSLSFSLSTQTVHHQHRAGCRVMRRGKKKIVSETQCSPPRGFGLAEDKRTLTKCHRETSSRGELPCAPQQLWGREIPFSVMFPKAWLTRSPTLYGTENNSLFCFKRDVWSAYLKPKQETNQSEGQVSQL